MGQFNHYTVTIGLKWLNCSSYKCRSFIVRKKKTLSILKKIISDFYDLVSIKYMCNTERTK